MPFELIEECPQAPLLAPFPYLGGKSEVASLVWERFGSVRNYVEAFAGSAAMLLARPHPQGTETLNDADGFVTNVYRAIRDDPDGVWQWSDWPPSELCQHARHAWLVAQRDDLTDRLAGDPDFYDAKIAGWWLWGICGWIGTGWCSGDGPWQVVDGKLVHLGNAGRGIHRQLVHLDNAGRGIHRQRVHLGHTGRGIHRKRVHLNHAGQGIHRQLNGTSEALRSYLHALADRLRRVRICSGDWQRVLGPTPTTKNGLTAIFMDPPYALDGVEPCYRVGHTVTIYDEVWAWAMAHGDDPLLRIVLCGYDDGREPAPGWVVVPWKARGGFGSQGQGQGRQNCTRERLYCSPHCLNDERALPLFAEEIS